MTPAIEAPRAWLRRARIAVAARRIEPRITWILGSPRSGSTWLMRLLGEHEAVVPINEPLIGHYLAPFVSDAPGANASRFDVGNFTTHRSQQHKPEHFFAAEFEPVWRPALGDLMRRRFAAHAVRYPSGVPLTRTIIAIQEPNGSQAADMLMAALPRSRLLFLLRDGRDVVDSWLAGIRPGGWVSQAFPELEGISAAERTEFVAQLAYKWLWRTEVVQEAFAAHRGPKLLVRYEDLRADTHRHLREIVDWLGLPVGDERLDALVERHAFESLPEKVRGERAFNRAATPGLWRENLSDDEQRAIHEIVGGKLAELGYAV
jgi:Sulfotransferase family